MIDKFIKAEQKAKGYFLSKFNEEVISCDLQQETKDYLTFKLVGLKGTTELVRVPLKTKEV